MEEIDLVALEGCPSMSGFTSFPAFPNGFPSPRDSFGPLCTIWFEVLGEEDLGPKAIPVHLESPSQPM